MQTGLQLCSFVIDIVLVVGFRSPTLEVETGTPPQGHISALMYNLWFLQFLV